MKSTLVVAAAALAVLVACKDEQKPTPAQAAAPAAAGQTGSLRDLTAAGLQVAAQAAGAAADALAKGKPLAEVAGQAAGAAVRQVAPGFEKLAEAAAQAAAKAGMKMMGEGGKALEKMGEAAMKMGLEALGKAMGGAGSSRAAGAGAHAEPNLPAGYSDHFPHPANAKTKLVTTLPTGGYIVNLTAPGQTVKDVAAAYKSGMAGKGWKAAGGVDSEDVWQMTFGKGGGKIASITVSKSSDTGEVDISVTASTAP